MSLIADVRKEIIAIICNNSEKNLEIDEIRYKIYKKFHYKLPSTIIKQLDNLIIMEIVANKTIGENKRQNQVVFNENKTWLNTYLAPSIVPAQFQQKLDAATNSLQNRLLNDKKFDLLYLISAKEVRIDHAISAIFTKMKSDNFKIADFSVEILRFIMKYGNQSIHGMVCSIPKLNELKMIIQKTRHKQIWQKIMKLILVWKHMFADTQIFAFLQHISNELLEIDFTFPIIKEEELEKIANTSLNRNQCLRCYKIFNKIILPLIPFGHPICQECIIVLNRLSPLPENIVKWKPKDAKNQILPVALRIEATSKKLKLPPFKATGEKSNDNFQKQLNLSEENSNIHQQPVKKINKIQPKDEPASMKECCICLDEKSTHSFIPCGHRCIGAECSKNFQKLFCPICRSLYSDIVQDS